MPDKEIERPSIAIYEQLRDRAEAEADEDGMTGPLIIVGKECWEPEDAIYWAAVEAIERRKSGSGLKTRVIVDRLPYGKSTWRAPIRDGRHANVELRPMREAYEDEASAKAAGLALVKSVFPAIEIE